MLPQNSGYRPEQQSERDYTDAEADHHVVE
jgi:hypothetical protein